MEAMDHAEDEMPAMEERRPWDDLVEAGPALEPVPLPNPTYCRGRRDDVVFLNGTNVEEAKNVLYRDFSSELGNDWEIERVYWPIPQKSPVKTIMGHVEICIVLTRSNTHTQESDDASLESEEELFSLTDDYVAVKVNYCDRIEQLKDSHAEDPLKEIAAMQIIGSDHPHVIGCNEVLFDGANLNVVMPFCGGGDLFQLLADHKRLNPRQPGLPEQQAQFFFRQIILGLRSMHSLGLCHRDLSPENVMLKENGVLVIDMGMCLRMPYTCQDPATGDIVLCDAAMTGALRRLIRPQGTCGKLPYMSPEVFVNREDFDGVAVDLWTAGTILFCMLTGNRSYARPHASDPQFYWMANGLTMLLKDWSVQISPEAVDLLQRLLQVDPRTRMSMDEVLEHPWLQVEDQANDFFPQENEFIMAEDYEMEVEDIRT